MALEKEYRRFLDESLAIDPLYFGVLCRAEDAEGFMKAMGDRPENYLNLAYEFIGFGFCDDAADILEMCPVDSPMVYYALSYALARSGDAKAAREAAERAEQLSTDLCFPNRCIERVILEYAAGLLKKGARVYYYLGNLLYDKKQYEKACECWEKATAAQPGLAPAHRNLSIACFNHGDRSKAAERIAKACGLEPGNSRFLLEQDQLLKKLGRPAKERLAILEKHKKIIPDRYALMLAYVSLLNETGRYEKALELLSGYTFHVWEGGEGKVADEYKKALFALAEKAIEKGRYEEAIEYAKRTLVYPDNLGEGKLDNVPDNRADYLIGCAYKKLGDDKRAAKYFKKATGGSQIPEPVRYYNDQPSDYIYYQGLAFHELGDDEKAKKSFHQLIIFGEQHIFDKVGYDFFAVSMPELEVYQDDIQARSDDYCRRMTELGRQGLAVLEK